MDHLEVRGAGIRVVLEGIGADERGDHGADGAGKVLSRERMVLYTKTAHA